ncbi:histidine kinase [Dysgonomonas sp. 216]|uniref:tetratricopeptide repeat-containing sensor histidine kinase n=1 Tax=Dysgonomonas sp. 216 TaxID=2302934 RepID=UPI001C86CA48|nr:histidine kinase [Dysgonomonas sp. 216]
MRFIFFLSLLVLSGGLIAQHKSSVKIMPKKNAAVEVTKSLEEGASDEKLAIDYENLAKEQTGKGELKKAEENYAKARSLYVKLKNTEKVALIDRELAKLKELQNNIDEAIVKYQSAARLSKSKVQQSLNTNDAGRLANISNPEARSNLIQQKIDILESTPLKEDKVEAFQQMAEVKLELKDTKAAVENLESALDFVKDKPEEAIKINRDIAKAYASDNQIEKAIEINEKLVEKAEVVKNPKVKVEQLQNLSNVYFEGKDTTKGLTSLKQAYNLALREGQTFEARNSLEILANYYKREKQSQEVIALYSSFIDTLEAVIKADTSLIDTKLYQITEEKIAQLEKERALKDQLIEKKNRFNYVLIGSIILILTCSFFIVRAWYLVRKRNKKIALQSLRREMNPHFIFNSLNSVNQFIAQNNELEANKYLSSYSKLMRNIMENSNKDFVPLSLEMNQMQEYLELEHIRFNDKFDFEIYVEDSIDSDTLYVPNMIIQPQLENAIWHGLRYKESKGVLKLEVKQSNDYLYITIEDDGIGLTKSAELKTKHQKAHKSRGVNNTRERIELLNSLYKSRIILSIEEKTNGATGVIVTISFPLDLYKNR